MQEKGPMSPSRAPTSTSRDLKWVEGLRGVAAVGVAIHHVTLVCFKWLEHSAESKEKLGSIFYLPPFRMFAYGHGWLSLFFLLIGFVNSYKPIKLARRGEIPIALTGLNSSAFRRTWRFVLPPTLATVIAWALVNTGRLELSRQINNEWLKTTTPAQSGSLPEAIKNLFYAIYCIWAGPDFSYEKNLWVMRDLLMASFWVYVVLLATIRCAPKYRMAIFFALYVFRWCCHDIFEFGSTFGGMFLAEVSQASFNFPSMAICSTVVHKVRLVLVLALASFGMLAFCFTDQHSDYMTWTTVLLRIGSPYFPASEWMPNGDAKTYWPVFGAHLLTVAILLSPGTQHVLSHPRLVWLGGLSYPFYLLHGMVIRVFLVWLLYGLREPVWLYTKDANGNIDEAWQTIPRPERWMYLPCIAAFLIVSISLSHFWNQWIEPWFGWITAKAEEHLCPRLAEAQKRADVMEEGLPTVNQISLGERVPLMNDTTQEAILDLPR